MDKMIESTCNSCLQCQQNQRLPTKSPGMWTWPSGPWKRIHIDYAGPFMNSMFLIVVDAHSKWLEVFKTTRSSSQDTSNCLTSIFAKYGLPEHIVSDNGTCFTSYEFQRYLDQYGIRHTTTSPGHPASNGLAERYVGFFKQQMRKLSNSELSIEERIQKILFSYRTTPHPSTGETPAKLLMGRELRTRFSNLKPSLQTTKEIELCEKMKTTSKFTQGDLVYALNLRSGPRWVPGYVIDGKFLNYYIQVGTQVWKRHEDQLRVRKVEHNEKVQNDDDEMQLEVTNTNGNTKKDKVSDKSDDFSTEVVKGESAEKVDEPKQSSSDDDDVQHNENRGLQSYRSLFVRRKREVLLKDLIQEGIL